jgi:hypothetical protein
MTEMSDDELRTRLARLDPAPAGSPVDPVTSPRAQELVERAMQTPETQTVPTPDPADELAARRRRPWLIPAVAAAVLAVMVGTVISLFGGGGGTPAGDGSTEDPMTLALSVAPSDVASSCIMFDVEYLAEMPVALAGTVTAIEPRRVTLEVDRWYRGGDADLVTIGVQDTNSVALDGVEFVEGERYLVTATNGVINGCGFSGPATPELEQAFEEAFAG